jgi:KAP family P-loop domain
LFSFACWLWVNPIAQHISGNLWISIPLIAIVSFFYYEGFLQKKSKTLLASLLVSTIILVRTWNYWEFRGCYFTMPFLLLVIYIIAEIFPKKKSDKKERPSDELKREGFAESILADIKEKHNLEHSYNYGLVGEWGSGKSFLMEMMYEKMKNEPKTFITYYFKPWEAPNEKEFAIQILNGIKSNSENYELETKINKFLSKIETDSGDILTKTFTTFFSWLISDDSSIDDIKKDLSNYLKKNDKRLVVFLDDLDRLDQSEIKELLRLMRNTFDIPYLFFVVGFDRNYLTNILGFNDNEFDNYISKFFQVKTNVPLLNKTDLFNKYYKDKICTILLRDPSNFEEKEEFRNIITENILELIDTPRDYENIIASFDLSYRNLKNNCDLFTLFQLEVIKHCRYQLYAKIKYDKLVFEDTKELSKHNLTKKDEELIFLLKVSTSFGQYKLDDIKYFHKYFSLVNAKFEINQNEFDNLISSGNIEQIEMIFTGWLKQNKYDDLDKKLNHFLNKKKHISAQVLIIITIDKIMASGLYARHDVYLPIFRYLILLYDEKGESIRDYLKSIHESLDPNSIARNIAYFLIDNDFSSKKIDTLIDCFKFLIKDTLFNDNQLFYFVQNFIGKISYLEMPFHQIETSKRDEIILSFNEKIHSIILDFARNNIVEFLQNFTMSNMENASYPVYLIYDNLVPKLLGYDEVLNLLSSKEQSETVLELSDFIENLKESSIDTNGNSIVVVRNFTFSHNEKIVDKS